MPFSFFRLGTRHPLLNLREQRGSLAILVQLRSSLGALVISPMAKSAAAAEGHQAPVPCLRGALAGTSS